MPPNLILYGNVYVLDPDVVTEIVESTGQYPVSMTGSVPVAPYQYQVPSNYIPTIYVPSPLQYQSPPPSAPPGYYPPISPYSFPAYAIPPGSSPASPPGTSYSQLL